MKKKLTLLLSLMVLGNVAFGSDTSTATSKISLTAFSLMTIDVEDINFGNYVVGGTKPTDPTGNIAITGGTEGAEVRLAVPMRIELTRESGSEKAIVSMSVEDGDNNGDNNTAILNLDDSGEATSVLTASLFTEPVVAGNYSGTATVTASYN